jgi:hypothetical protein
MDKDQIVTLINTKLAEHKHEMVECAKYVPTQQDLVKNNRNVKEAGKLMVIKDKLLFHKACVLLLEDLLKDINEKV